MLPPAPCGEPWLRRRSTAGASALTADVTQTLRTAYRDIGLVVGPQMRRLFGQAPGRRPEWAVVDLVSGQCGRARDVVAEDLFGSIPPH